MSAFAALVVLVVLSRYNYLVFHISVEFFSIIVVAAIFLFAWNARRYLSNNYILFLSFAFMFVGLLDFIHALAYRGMNILPVTGSNAATQLWIAARFLQALSLLIAPFLIHRRLNFRSLFFAYSMTTGLLLASIFYWGIFPECYAEGIGLTLFKKAGEYVISLLLVVSGVLFYKKRAEFDEEVSRLIIAAIVFTIASELAFTLYADVYGYLNTLGHLLKIVAFYLLYKALLKIGLERPHSIVFRELKEKEKALKISYDFVRAVLDSMNDAVSIINPADFSIIDCNTVFLKDLRAAREDVVGRKCYELTHQLSSPCRAPHDTCPMADTLKTGKHSMYEHVHYDADGNTLHVEVSTSPITDESGKVIYIVHAARNITERKLAEEKISRLNEHLNRHIEELKKAKELAEAAARAKSEFLANMSHEIRTPMNAIIGMAHLAREANPSPEQKEYLEVINHASQGLLTLLNDILHLSKIESGKLVLESIVFDLKTIITDSLSVIGLQAAEKGLTLTHSIQPGIPSVLKGDPMRLKQVLVNLLGNSVKFTDKGGISLLVEAIPLAEGMKPTHLKLLFSVRDTGIGIPQERQKDIFDEFSQVDGSITRRYGGTGLGLAISRRLVELMDGDIRVESEPRKGTTFHFSAAFEIADAIAIANHFMSEDASLTELLEGLVLKNRPLNILLVEDNDYNQILAVRLLEKDGHAVTVAGNGAKAIEHLEKQRFDLVLMDIHMPEMDGFTATGIIRDAASNVLDHAVPIIAMTANAMSGDRDKCLAAGMNDYISKPINPKGLYAKIRKLTSGGQTEKPDLITAEVEGPRKNPVIIDMVKFYSYVGSLGEETMTMLIDAFKQSSSERMKSLMEAFEAGDTEALLMEAHTMKSMAASQGAEALESIAYEIETAARNRQLASEQTMYKLKEELEKVLKVL